jgi:predicted Zn-dependent protease with MMP-like domain
LDKLDNVAIVIADDPTPAQKKELKLRSDDLLFGLYEGIEQIRRGRNYTPVLPDKITIFKNPILEYADTPKQVIEIVKNTVWHEIAHHFGIDERKVRQLERKRNRLGISFYFLLNGTI